MSDATSAGPTAAEAPLPCMRLPTKAAAQTSPAWAPWIPKLDPTKIPSLPSHSKPTETSVGEGRAPPAPCRCFTSLVKGQHQQIPAISRSILPLAAVVRLRISPQLSSLPAHLQIAFSKTIDAIPRCTQNLYCSASQSPSICCTSADRTTT